MFQLHTYMNNIYCTYVWQNKPFSFLSILFSLSFFMHSKAFIHCTKGKTSFPILIPFPPLYYTTTITNVRFLSFFMVNVLLHILVSLKNVTVMMHAIFHFLASRREKWYLMCSGQWYSMVAEERKESFRFPPSFRIHNAQALVLPTTHFRHEYKINQDFFLCSFDSILCFYILYTYVKLMIVAQNSFSRSFFSKYEMRISGNMIIYTCILFTIYYQAYV